MQEDWGTKLRVGSALSLLVGQRCVSDLEILCDLVTYGHGLDSERRGAILLQEHC